ncbi:MULTISPECIES: UvrD-helicase domain-containing protein [Micromonospora]|nr:MULTISPECIES: UvrD-helicase domain-containing protein [Micromonospora]
MTTRAVAGNPAVVPRHRSRLTDEQLRAITAKSACVFIEAAPGSGKTTVAAQRFGLLRFATPVDSRAVVAVSFTRSATKELQQRVIRAWGFAALTPPHRIITIDTLLWEVLTFLLRAGHLTWPGGHTNLTVIDTWKLRLPHNWTRYQPSLKLDGRDVTTTAWWATEAKSRVLLAPFKAAVGDGVCTHDDVRRVLAYALDDPQLEAIVADRIAASVRALIVDEVFDANPLDLALVSSAADRGVSTTIIGDPWQALYRFRGAGPHLVPNLVEANDFATFPLTRSFRFITAQTQSMARMLREKVPLTVLPRAGQELDVVLAATWKELWNIGGDILPLSFGSPDSVPAAAALLLLDFVTSTAFGAAAVFRDEALTQLGIVDVSARTRLEPFFSDVVATLQEPVRSMAAEKRCINRAWDQLVAAIGTESQREFPRRHHSHTERLTLLRQHILSDPHRPVPGITIHQAKGREWRCVGVCLDDTDIDRLFHGLDETQETDRRLYVALTRGKELTVVV